MARKPGYLRRIVKKEIMAFAPYFDHIFEWTMPLGQRSLFSDETRISKLSSVSNAGEIPAPSESDRDPSRLIVLDGVLNHHNDIQSILKELNRRSTRSTRVAVVVYNSYLRPLYAFANLLKIRTGKLPQNFVTRNTIAHVAKLTGFECVTIRPFALSPVPLLGLDKIINWVAPLIPGLRWMSTCALVVLRPLKTNSKRPTLSVVMAARNEMGNIEGSVKRLLSDTDVVSEIVFVEGHSKDKTWEEIVRVKEAYGSRISIKALQQTGIGKADAVRLGFKESAGDLVIIHDADLTIDPEAIRLFYDAYVQGHGDFINGTRLALPMEPGAMRPLNFLGNVFFAKSLSSVLSIAIGDSLCANKLISRRDYYRGQNWRDSFGDFDPFGDFEILFPASTLHLGVIDVPVLYKARIYGETNISRFKHGLMLLKMTLIGLFRVKTGRV